MYFPESGPNANAHLWADAFANFGFAGSSRSAPSWGSSCCWSTGSRGAAIRAVRPDVALAGLSLASSALFTTLLTLGLGVGCLMIALMPRARA